MISVEVSEIHLYKPCLPFPFPFLLSSSESLYGLLSLLCGFISRLRVGLSIFSTQTFGNMTIHHGCIRRLQWLAFGIQYVYFKEHDYPTRLYQKTTVQGLPYSLHKKNKQEGVWSLHSSTKNHNTQAGANRSIDND